MVSTLATCCPSAHDHSQTPCRQKVWLGHVEGEEVAKKGSAGRASPLAEWPPALRLFSHTTGQIAVLKKFGSYLLLPLLSAVCRADVWTDRICLI